MAGTPDRGHRPSLLRLLTTLGARPMTCPHCGANVALVGKMHRCVPRPAEPVDVANTIRGGDVANTTYRYRDPAKRRAYMRELMRRRRAAQH
jgi:hypothetical protein